MGAVRRLVPDLDDELCYALGQVEELLLTLAVWEDDPDQQVELPLPLVGRVALDALNRVQGVITTTRAATTSRPVVAGCWGRTDATNTGRFGSSSWMTLISRPSPARRPHWVAR